MVASRYGNWRSSSSAAASRASLLPPENRTSRTMALSWLSRLAASIDAKTRSVLPSRLMSTPVGGVGDYYRVRDAGGSPQELTVVGRGIDDHRCALPGDHACSQRCVLGVHMADLKRQRLACF